MPGSSRHWTPADDALLRAHAQDMEYVKLGALFHPPRTKKSCIGRARVLGIKSGRACHSRPWTKLEDQIIKKYCGTLTAREVSGKLTGRTPGAIKAQARKLGCSFRLTPAAKAAASRRGQLAGAQARKAQGRREKALKPASTALAPKFNSCSSFESPRAPVDPRTLPRLPLPYDT